MRVLKVYKAKEIRFRRVLKVDIRFMRVLKVYIRYRRVLNGLYLVQVSSKV